MLTLQGVTGSVVDTMVVVVSVVSAVVCSSVVVSVVAAVTGGSVDSLMLNEAEIIKTKRYTAI